MRRLLFAVLLGFSLGIAVVPAARALDPETLRRDLIEALDGGFAAFSAEAFHYTGIRTTAQGEAVRVEIMDLALPLPDLGGRLELGDLAFTVADEGAGAGSAAGDGRYRVSRVKTATKATVIGDAGNKTVLVNYRLERLDGVWSAAFRNFLDLDMAMSGFEVVVPEDSLGFALAEIAAVNRSRIRADGLTDMEGEARATGLRVINPDFGTLQIGELFADYDSRGQDLDGVRSFAETFQSLAGRETPPDRNEIAAILERLAKINILPQGFIERFRLTDLTYLDAAQQPLFHLDGIEMDVAAGELHLPLGFASLGVKLTGVRAESLSGAPGGAPSGAPGGAPGGGAGGGAIDPLQALVPRNVGLIASVERFPVRLVWQGMTRGMVLSLIAGGQGPSSDAFGDAIGAEMQAAINEAGTILRLDRLDVETPTGRVIAEGVLRVDAAAAAGAQGHLDLTITGLDEMIAAAMSSTQSGQANPEILGNMMFLMMLKTMAQREAGPDGTPIDRLAAVLTAAGEITVNGQPFGMAPPRQ